MDLNSICSSNTSMSDGLSNDTFEITRRGRQDVLMEGRMESPFLGRVAADFSFPSYAVAARPASYQFPSSVPCAAAPSVSSSSSSKRKVNFAGQKVINEGASEQITEEEMRVRWWSQDDLDEIKQAAKEMSLRLRKAAKERGCYVETAHKKTSLMLANNFQELVKMSSSSPDQDLRHWCARSDGRRGLERFASREYGNTRKEDVVGTREAVFAEQQRQRQHQMFEEEALAKVSKAKSRRARTFSLFMGEADAQAAVRGVSRRSSKRCKVAQNSSPSSSTATKKHHQLPARTPSAEVRNFAASVDAPLLTSSA